MDEPYYHAFWTRRPTCHEKLSGDLYRALQGCCDQHRIISYGGGLVVHSVSQPFKASFPPPSSESRVGPTWELETVAKSCKIEIREVHAFFLKWGDWPALLAATMGRYLVYAGLVLLICNG
jgi:hypothetical protein